MNRLIERNVWLALFVALLAAGAGATQAAAQQMAAGDRIQIMVPRLAPMNDADDGFGKDVAEELRDMINELHTHEAVSGKNIDRARKDYDLDNEDLYNCVRARQLAMQKNWGLVLCGEYEEVGNDSIHVEARSQRQSRVAKAARRSALLLLQLLWARTKLWPRSNG